MVNGIAAHGGTLVNRVLDSTEREEWLRREGDLPRLRIDDLAATDLDMIACGALSPLEGFMGLDDLQSVVDTMRLASVSAVWPMPIVLAVSTDEAARLPAQGDIALEDADGTVLAVLHLEEKFDYPKRRVALEVYGTEDDAHPGVANVLSAGEVCLGGRVSVLRRRVQSAFMEYRHDPAALREQFKHKGWKRIVGFQTRNPIHRAHEYLQKCALEIVDGLLLHPLMGATKSDDIPADVRMRCYEAIFEGYYPKDRTMISVFPAYMRYAGPREAIFHALVRKNFGCTHFIVGRDHAGVGSYYGTFDAQYIFDEFAPEELGIIPLFFDYTHYCRKCDGMASLKTCPHPPEYHVALSGTKVREMLHNGEMPPPEFSRPEVAQILVEAYRTT